MDKTSFFLLNIFINSFLAFFTSVFLIETLLFLFRIKQGRVAAILRMTPILKLPFDLFLYDFSKWSYIQGINPLICEKGSRTFLIESFPLTSKIQFTAFENTTFTIGDLMGQSMNPSILYTLALIFLFLCLSAFLKKAFSYSRFTSSLHQIAKSSLYENRQIKNNNFQIATSDSLTGSPFVAGWISPVIYIPSNLSKNLSKKEYEAVLAHEIEHIRHKDILVRLILDFISSMFWWIPTKWLQKKIEEGQEIGCDLNCTYYGVQPIDLASAICKSAKTLQGKSALTFAYHLTKHPIHKRINMLLERPSLRFKKVHILCCSLATGIALLVVFIGRFWIF